MSILTENLILLQANVESKEDAIRKCGQLLVAAGRVEAGYVDGMLAREETMSTYLGNGVSIPHGEYDNRAQILKTGLSILQIPQGVEWEDGEKAYLVIGIAAQEDEHVNVLAKLAEAVEEEEITKLLTSTKDKQVIMDYLGEGV